MVTPTTALWAQAPSYELQVYASDSEPSRSRPLRTFVIPSSLIRCDQTVRVAPAVPFNPSTIRWQDPHDASKDCIADVSTFFQQLPVAKESYLATLTMTTVVGTSPRSAASNLFFRVAAFSVP